MDMRKRERKNPITQFLRTLTIVVVACGLTAAFFLVLPVIQAISGTKKPDVLLQEMTQAEQPPPPPPPPEEEKDPEPEKEPEPPKLAEEQPLLDLAQLDLALSGMFGSGFGGPGVGVNLSQLTDTNEETDASFSIADLDQDPRLISDAAPRLDPKLRKAGGGTVLLAFYVNEHGAVEEPVVLKSSNPIFDRPALSAVKKWRFEPGKKNGRPTRRRVRQSMTFPES